jgi:pimeloyl-ACP methyl ester carboxylesterase
LLTSERVPVRGGPAQAVFRGGRGEPLVWLHGVQQPEADDPVLLALAERFDLYAPIAPGYDELSELDEICDVRDLALQYDGLLEALGLSGVALGGHSFGAMIAAETAAHYPQRASSLVLVSPLGLWNDAYPVADLLARPVPEMDDLLWQGAARRPAPRLKEEAADPAEQVERLVAMASRLTTVAKFTWPIPDRGLRRRLPRIRARTLVLFGADDAFTPAAYADDFAALLERGEKRVRAGGHMLPYEDPGAFASEVADFSLAAASGQPEG